MFYLIGLGLCDEKDITIRGLEVCMGIGDIRFTDDEGYQTLRTRISRSLYKRFNDRQGQVG